MKSSSTDTKPDSSKPFNPFGASNTTTTPAATTTTTAPASSEASKPAETAEKTDAAPTPATPAPAAAPAAPATEKKEEEKEEKTESIPQADGAASTTGDNLQEPEYDVEVKLSDMQADPNNPLYSIKSFGDLGLYVDSPAGFYHHLQHHP